MDALTAIHSRRAIRDYRAEPAPADVIAEGKAALGVPPAFRAVAPIIVGRPKGAVAPTTRRTADVRFVAKVSPP